MFNWSSEQEWLYFECFHVLLGRRCVYNIKQTKRKSIRYCILILILSSEIQNLTSRTKYLVKSKKIKQNWIKLKQNLDMILLNFWPLVPEILFGRLRYVFTQDWNFPNIFLISKPCNVWQLLRQLYNDFLTSYHVQLYL